MTAALTRGRAFAEAMQVDACTIQRKGAGAPVFNPSTGGYTDPPPLTVYSGKCKVQVTDSLTVSAVDFGGRAVNIIRATVHIPVTVDVEVKAEDTVLITAAVNDPQLVGDRFVVRDYVAKTHATARRIEVERAGS